MSSKLSSKNFKKNDFIEIEFTGRIKDTGEIFDSNIKEDLKKLPNFNPSQAKPFIFALGQGMFLQAVENYILENSETGKNYTITLQPERAFGERNSKFIQLLPMKIFQQQKVNPVPGVVFNFDGRIGKILSVSGGRIMVDFNHPLAGKIVVYEIKIIRKVEELNEEIKAFINFLFRRELNFQIDENNKKLIIEAEKEMKPFIELFLDKFNELFGLELNVKEIKAEIKKVKKEQ